MLAGRPSRWLEGHVKCLCGRRPWVRWVIWELVLDCCAEDRDDVVAVVWGGGEERCL